MNETTQLSILILETAKGKGLEATLDSIASQLFTDYKIYFLTNPQPSEKDGSIIPEFSKPLPEFTLLVPDTSKTTGGLLNFAIRQIDTPFIMFMKENDTLGPSFIYKCMERFEQNSLLEDPEDIPLSVGKTFCSNPIVLKKNLNIS